MAAKLAPDLAGRGNPALRLGQGRQAQVGERHPLGMKQAEHVVIGPHQQGNGVGIRFVSGEHRGVDVTMRRDERETSDLLVKRCSYFA
jgi:hypothetical protein